MDALICFYKMTSKNKAELKHSEVKTGRKLAANTYCSDRKAELENEKKYNTDSDEIRYHTDCINWNLLKMFLK